MFRDFKTNKQEAISKNKFIMFEKYIFFAIFKI